MASLLVPEISFVTEFFLLNLQSPQKYRAERDTFGDLQVPADRYWGAQTQRFLNVII